MKERRAREINKASHDFVRSIDHKQKIERGGKVCQSSFFFGPRAHTTKTEKKMSDDPNDRIMKEAYEQLKETGDMYAYTQVHQACGDGGGYAGSAGSETGADVVSAVVDVVVEAVNYLTSDSK